MFQTFSTLCCVWRDLVFQTIGWSHLWSLQRGLQLVFPRWVKPLRNLERFSFSFNIRCGFRSSRSTSDLLTVVSLRLVTLKMRQQKVKTIRYGLETALYRAHCLTLIYSIWSRNSSLSRSLSNVNLFKSKIKHWECTECSCKLRKTYLKI